MNNQVVILVISHKSGLNKNERLSLKQLFKILGHYPITFICPVGLDVSLYSKINKSIKFDFIDPFWQSSYQNFARLKLSLFLYERYSKFKFIFFFEPDAFVFRDDLDYWFNQGYDIIGAPLAEVVLNHLKIEHLNDFDEELKLSGPIYNGGFSLRRTSSLISFIKENDQSIQNYLDKNWGEDVIISLLMQQSEKYKLATYEVALKFSFESNPAAAFKINKKQLPMGCHAWFRQDYGVHDNMFWFKHIRPLYYYSKLFNKYLSEVVERNLNRLGRIKKFVFRNV